MLMPETLDNSDDNIKSYMELRALFELTKPAV